MKWTFLGIVLIAVVVLFARWLVYGVLGAIEDVTGMGDGE